MESSKLLPALPLLYPPSPPSMLPRRLPRLGSGAGGLPPQSTVMVTRSAWGTDSLWLLPGSHFASPWPSLFTRTHCRVERGGGERVHNEGVDTDRQGSSSFP